MRRGEKRLRKVGRTARIESSEDEGLGAHEDASKQGRKIADLDADAGQIMVSSRLQEKYRGVDIEEKDQKLFVELMDKKKKTLLQSLGKEDQNKTTSKAQQGSMWLDSFVLWKSEGCRMEVKDRQKEVEREREKILKSSKMEERPEEAYERVLWGDLKVMFESDVESEVWRNLQGYNVIVWKLFSSSGVHFEHLESAYLDAGRENLIHSHPATMHKTCSTRKLQTDHWNELCYSNFLKLMTNQLAKNLGSV
ncbi:hypothetical protein Tco_0335592 [Tanacetum coccineum]